MYIITNAYHNNNNNIEYTIGRYQLSYYYNIIVMSVFFFIFGTRLLKSRDRREMSGGRGGVCWRSIISLRYKDFITGRGRSYTHNNIIIIYYSVVVVVVIDDK